ncbi:Hypothetical predicted protein [Podarcis lilfordi]|uniref:Uncharacterized protein n=1 Tax=Podarcis lilfordi TaxID=74358 RepID=A0AA35KBW8_9SAUR|nr:Hypothetical predicted protein [Podarcis lilfordi]
MASYNMNTHDLSLHYAKVATWTFLNRNQKQRPIRHNLHANYWNRPPDTEKWKLAVKARHQLSSSDCLLSVCGSYPYPLCSVCCSNKGAPTGKRCSDFDITLFRSLKATCLSIV